MTTLLWIGGALLALFAVLVVVLVIMNRGRRHGVQIGNEIDRYAFDLVARGNFLDENERLLLWYDRTLRLDGSEAALLTSTRVVYANQGRVFAIPYLDIAAIERSGRDVIVRSSTGETMKIHIHSGDGAELFHRELTQQWKRLVPYVSPQGPTTPGDLSAGGGGLPS